MKVVIGLLGFERQGGVEFVGHAVLLAGAQDTHYCVVFSIDLDTLANDVGPAAEAASPEFMHENDFVVISRLPFLWEEVPAHEKRRTPAGEQAWAGLRGLNLFGLITAAQIGAEVAFSPQSLEGAALVFPVEIIAGGDAIAMALDARPDHDELIGIRAGHGREECGIDYAEDRGVRANAQSEGEHGNEGSSLVFAQDAQAE